MNVEPLNSEPGERLNGDAPAPLTIVLWFWRDPRAEKQPYTVERVNIAARMIHRNLSLPHRVVVVTDHPRERWDEFESFLEPVPLWDDWRDLRRPGWLGPTCYVRLKAFSREMAHVLGPRFVSMDIDLLVLKPLDPLFDRPEDFLIFRRQIASARDELNFYQGSMWMMNAGSREYVWTEFQGLPSIERAARFLGSDQAWMRYRLPPDEAGWSDQDGVYGYTRISRNSAYAEKPPENARVIFFYDKVKPWHVEKTAPAKRRQRCHQCGAFLRPSHQEGAYSWVAERYAEYVK